MDQQNQANTGEQKVQVQKSGTCGGGCAKAAILFFGLSSMAVVLFVVLIMYGSESANTKLEKYFTFASKSTIADITQTFHSSLIAAADPARLAMLIKALPTHYGPFKNVEIKGFSFSDNYNNGVRTREYKGNAVFEKGTIPIEMVFLDEELAGFRVNDEKAAQILLAMLAIPEDLAPYKETAEKLIRALLTGKEDEAFSLMSKPLQEALGKGQLAQHCKNFVSNGAVKSIEFVDAFKDNTDADRVIFMFKCTIGKYEVAGHVAYEFHGLNSYLIAYEIPSSKVGK
jgi:hypothetical protein